MMKWRINTIPGMTDAYRVQGKRKFFWKTYFRCYRIETAEHYLEIFKELDDKGVL